MGRAKAKADAAFELFTKLGTPYYCFHDLDLVEEGNSLSEYECNLATIVDHAKQHQQASGVKLSWSTANVFLHPRYMNGTSTNPDFAVVAHAATQVKNAIDATIAPGVINFDAKTRRNSTDLEDIFVAHIAGMDTFARALVTADTILQKSGYQQFRQARYASFDSGQGAAFAAGQLMLADLRRLAHAAGEPTPHSGKQEWLESLINQYL